MGVQRGHGRSDVTIVSCDHNQIIFFGGKRGFERHFTWGPEDSSSLGYVGDVPTTTPQRTRGMKQPGLHT